MVRLFILSGLSLLLLIRTFCTVTEGYSKEACELADVVLGLLLLLIANDERSILSVRKICVESSFGTPLPPGCIPGQHRQGIPRGVAIHAVRVEPLVGHREGSSPEFDATECASSSSAYLSVHPLWSLDSRCSRFL